ncbi:SDR family oxidoreductase [Aquibacillus koreensis]|uniref:SDR family oxidoreductase n=1 Tax=Aquibacillus koreensis TaxID=279446 RepID=A0A9X3WL48_9BACI|nr:SDR family oxidoreductase [Aquibacillus koreensis]MCT2536173.1 SDR family oxidoreductase [Aquibacillus koreensis]MDC3422097.1 SDR family oxidoreductase [Aquibacillus koreensis]
MSIYSKDALKDHHALITGATGGIGFETALVLASMGANITITGRKQDKLELLKEKIFDENPQASVFMYQADLSDSNQIEYLVNTASKEMGDISLLVNAAGVLGGDIVENLTQDELEKVMHMNYTVPILLSQQVYKQMKQNKKGAIVNVSSLSGLRGTYGGTAYCGSKFALIGFTHAFALEAIEHGVRVNAVCPGFVETEMGRKAIEAKAKRENRSFDQQYKLANTGLPSGRISTPEEVANTIAFLLSDAATNIVGESVKISGGAVMR